MKKIVTISTLILLSFTLSGCEEKTENSVENKTIQETQTLNSQTSNAF